MRKLLPLLALTLLPLASHAAALVRACTITSAAPYGAPGALATATPTLLAYVSTSSTGAAPFCQLLSARKNSSTGLYNGFVNNSLDGKSWISVTSALAAAGGSGSGSSSGGNSSSSSGGSSSGGATGAPPPSQAKYVISWAAQTTVPTYNLYTGPNASSLTKVASAVKSPFTLATSPSNLCVGLTTLDNTGESTPTTWCGSGLASPAAPSALKVSVSP